MERSFRLKYGFIMSGYRDRTYFWEIVIHIRKAIFIWMIVLLIPRGAGPNSPVVMISLSVFVALQVVQTPYLEPELNNMELISYSVLLCTVYCGLYYQTNIPSEYDGARRYSLVFEGIGSGIIFTVLFFAFFVFVHYFTRKMHHEILLECSQRDKRNLFMIMTLNLITLKEFREKNIRHEDLSDLYESDQEDEFQKQVTFNRMHTFNKLSTMGATIQRSFNFSFKDLLTRESVKSVDTNVDKSRNKSIRNRA